MVFEFDPGVRVQALTLHAEGASRAKISEKTGYSTSAFTVLLRKAKSRGYVVGGPVLLEYVIDSPGRGRPKVRSIVPMPTYELVLYLCDDELRVSPSYGIDRTALVLVLRTALTNYIEELQSHSSTAASAARRGTGTGRDW